MATIVSGSQFHIERGKRRVLLVNPPVYDLRLDWARWQQPYGLLQLGATLKERGADVRLLDFVAEGCSGDGRLIRRQISTFHIDGEELTWWCYGLPWSEVARRARRWHSEGWEPDEVWVTTLTSFWWKGAQEVIRRSKYDWWPRARILLGGVYPTLYPNHAAANTEADLVVSGPVHEASPVSDLTLYDHPPSWAGIRIENRHPVGVIDEIIEKTHLGVREFAFFDDEIPGADPMSFDYLLQLIEQRHLKIRLVVLGNLGARDVTMARATWLYAAGLAEVYLRWDPTLNGDMLPYHQAAQMLETFAGFKPRAGALSAIVHAGWPGENLEDTARHLIYLAHAVGSVMVFPYQPTPAEAQQLGIAAPDLANGKLFPFAAVNGVRFADYADLLRLAATLNSKYRDVTFDFLSDDMIARMIRTSIRANMWQPVKANIERVDPPTG